MHIAINTAGNMENDALQRSDTATTLPLSDEEYNSLQQQLANDGVAVNPQASNFSLLQTPQNSEIDPTTAQWHIGGGGGGGDGRNYVLSSSNSVTPGPSQQISMNQQPMMLLRGDTMDNNPGFINPHDVDGGRLNDQYQVREDVWLVQSDEIKTEETPVDLNDLEEIIREQQLFQNHQHFQQVQPQQQQQVVVLHPLHPSRDVPSPTSASPSYDNWPGEHNFTVTFQQLAPNAKNKTWDFSSKLNKLFIDFNKNAIVNCHVGRSPPEGLFVRALPVYAVASSCNDPVKRCPNHAELSDDSNRGFAPEFRWHLIRVNHDGAIYEEDANSHRLSVIVPLARPQAGTEYSNFGLKFMCLGSDIGGINRRPLKVIFTLETGPGYVIGRHSVDVRICSCPKRDKQQEEERFMKEQAVRSAADNLARVNSNLVLTQPTTSKKRKVDKNNLEEMIMMPVARADFEKMNEFAEAAMILRTPAQAAEIKAQRKQLLEKHNPGLATKRAKK